MKNNTRIAEKYRADYGQPSYIQYYRNQLTELFTQYGPVFEMWFDGANGGDGYYAGAKEKRKIDGANYYDWPTTLDLVRKLEPNILFFSDAGPGLRWVGNERGQAGATNWNTISTDTLFAGKSGIENLLQSGSPDGNRWVPAEVDVSIRPGWFYHAKEDTLVKTPEQLFDIYLSSVGRGSTLLLNVPPDRTGQFHQTDVQALFGFRKLLDRELGHNLALHAAVSSDSYRGRQNQFAAARLTDGNPDSYWATDDSVKTGIIQISLPAAKTIRYVQLQEYINLGQRVKSFTIEAWSANAWKTVAQGTTIGHKRILRIDPVSTDKIRVSITDAKACPVISEIALF